MMHCCEEVSGACCKSNVEQSGRGEPEVKTVVVGS